MMDSVGTRNPQKRVEDLLCAYLGDPRMPRCEEVQRLVAELAAQQSQLEAQNQELRESQRRLEAYRDRYVQLYESAPVGYATLDEDGYVQEINLAGAKLLNTDCDGLIGYDFGAYVAREDMESFLSHVRQCVGQRQEATSEVSLLARDGRVIPVLLHSIPVEAQEAEGVFCKTAIADLSEHKKLEDTVRRSQAFLQMVIDAMPDMMVVIDLDFRIVQANRAARAAAGGADPVMRCMMCYEMLHGRGIPCGGPNAVCPLKQVLATKAPVAVTHVHYDDQGREIFLDVRASPVFNDAGEVTHVIELCRDITDRKQAERALRMTQFAVDHAGDAIFWVDRDARIVYANAQACRQLGYNPEEILALTVHDIDPNYPAEVWPAHWEELKRRGSLILESQHRTKDGGLFPVEVTVNYLEFDGKQYNSAHVRDITGRKRAEAEVHEAHQRLLELQQREKEFVEAELNKVRETLVRQTRLAAVGQLSGSIAHELRNPLASIGYAVALLRRKLPAEDAKCREYVDIVGRELQTADSIIDDCTAVSRGRPPAKKPVALSAVLAEARSRLEAPEGIEWRFPSGPDAFMIVADASQLSHVFKNLFMNAVQAIGNRGTIAVEAGHGPEWDEIRVSDTGPGIPKEVRHQIFEPLVTTKPRGTGLGLTICRQIVEQHGGHIDLSSAHGPGAAFVVRLPGVES